MIITSTYPAVSTCPGAQSAQSAQIIVAQGFYLPGQLPNAAQPCPTVPAPPITFARNSQVTVKIN